MDYMLCPVHLIYLLCSICIVFMIGFQMYGFCAFYMNDLNAFDSKISTLNILQLFGSFITIILLLLVNKLFSAYRYINILWVLSNFLYLLFCFSICICIFSHSFTMLDFIANNWENSDFLIPVSHFENQTFCCGYDDPVINKKRCKGIATRCKSKVEQKVRIPTLISCSGSFFFIFLCSVFNGLIIQNEICFQFQADSNGINSKINNGNIDDDNDQTMTL